MRKIYLLFIPLFFLACDPSNDFNTNSSMAYVPVYAKATDLETINVEAPTAIASPGKVYVIGNLLLQNDLNKGVHFIDITNRSKPQKITFLRVPYSTEIAVKGGYLFVNSFKDLLVFNIADPLNPALVKRIKNVFPYYYSEYPPASRTYFECVDPSKGIVVDWKLSSTSNAKCRR